uniref:B-cell receptor CD22-like n=1 Tax=Gasterosteus aculeatus aculeatus TaxID=481459 RepID=UPI001A98AD77
MCCVTVIQSQDGWRVDYRQTDICAVKGSTVVIRCDYEYPPGIYYYDIKDRFWFTKEKDGEPVDLRTDSEYSGRVTYGCYGNSCYLTITYVRESASPSAEMLEGDSVTLTCSTDANPAASYTWYKEHEDSPRASGQIFTITDFTAEHSGNYYCEAQ